MNRYKKELLKKYTPEEIKEMEARQADQQASDSKNFPELFSFMYDSSVDLADRKRGVSPMSVAFRREMRERFERGEYPERLHYLVFMELDLKHPKE